MATFELIDTVQRGVRRGGASKGKEFRIESNELNEMFVAQGLPPYAELTRRGAGWSVMTATAFAGIVALPTTLANLEVVNNHATRCMVIDTIWSWELTGTAVVWSHTPWAQVGTAVSWAHTPWAQVGTAVYSANTALVIYGTNGRASITSATGTEARTAVDQTVVANGWRPFPGSTMNFGTAAATPGGANVGQVDGRLVVPPDFAVHVTVTASVGTASAFHCGVSWFWADISAE